MLTTKNLFTPVMAVLLFSLLMNTPQYCLGQQPGDVDTSWQFSGYCQGTDYSGSGYDKSNVFQVINPGNGLVSFCGDAVLQSGGVVTNRSGTIYHASAGVKGLYANRIGSLIYTNIRFTAHAPDVAVGEKFKYYYAVGAADLRSAIFKMKYFGESYPLDTTFGTKGITRVTMDGSVSQERFYALAVQPDHKIIAVGSAGTSAQKWILARFDSMGNIDNNFGTSGKVLLPFGSTAAATRVVLLSSGKFIVTGSGSDGSNGGVIARFKDNGILDSTYNTIGYVYVPAATDMKLLDNDQVLLLDAVNKVIRKYTAAGAPDQNFGASGVVQLPAALSSASYMDIQATGKIVLGGSTNVNSRNLTRVVRLKQDGNIDNLFGNNGAVDVDFSSGNSEYIGGIAIDGTDNIVVATNIGDNNTFLTDWHALRLLAGSSVGILDTREGMEFMNVFPNPVNEQLTLSYELKKGQPVSIYLYDLQGKLVHQFLNEVKMPEGSHQQSLAFPAGISAGVYHLVLTCSDGKKTVRVFKQ